MDEAATHRTATVRTEGEEVMPIYERIICYAIGILTGYEIAESFKSGRAGDGIVLIIILALWIAYTFLRAEEE